jgi:hypothetical protein
MFLKDKLQTLKMKEGENVTKHIHKIWSLFQQLIVAGTFVQDYCRISYEKYA